MKFIPFQAPPSEHHTLNTGLSSENGVTAKGLIDGINNCFAHLFSVFDGEHQPEMVDADARAEVAALADHVTALEMKGEATDALIKQLQADIAELKMAPAPAPIVVAALPVEEPAEEKPAAEKPADASEDLSADALLKKTIAANG